MFKSVVLVADNKQATLDATSEALKQAGYATVEANSLPEARRKLEERRMDVAVLDVRLENDDDDKDYSGVTLAQTAAPEIPKVLYTTFPSPEVIRLASGPSLNGPPAVTSIVSKREGPDALVAAVASALRQSALRNTASQLSGRLAWLRVFAVVWLPVAFGFGVIAMATNTARWLYGTVVAGILAVIFMGASLIKSPVK
jgi:CheY-like chemotaxis protein